MLNNAEPCPYEIPAVIVLVDAEYERVRDSIQKMVTTRWGILEDQEDPAGHITMKPSAREILNENLNWPMLGQGLVRLQGSASPL